MNPFFTGTEKSLLHKSPPKEDPAGADSLFGLGEEKRRRIRISSPSPGREEC
jgi:hypothetical protein